MARIIFTFDDKSMIEDMGITREHGVMKNVTEQRQRDLESHSLHAYALLDEIPGFIALVKLDKLSKMKYDLGQFTFMASSTQVEF